MKSFLTWALALTLCAVSYAEVTDKRLVVKFKNETTVAGEQIAPRTTLIRYPDSYAAHNALQRFRKNPNVEWVEFDKRVKRQDRIVPNDPWFPNWQREHYAVYAPEMWAVSTGTSKLAAMLDMGFVNHEDFANNFKGQYKVVNYPGEVVGEHGMLVAGTFGARGNNGIGVAGVSWNTPFVGILITDNIDFAYSSDIAKGIDKANSLGAKIVNCSYGLLDSSSIIDAAKRLYQNGGLFFAPSGNDGQFINWQGSPWIVFSGGFNGGGYPGAENWYEYGMNVIRNGVQTWIWHANYGPYVDVSSPMVTTSTTSIINASTGTVYRGWGGTSCSSPKTAGMAANIWGANPGLSNAQVENILKTGVIDLLDPGYDIHAGYGIPDGRLIMQLALGTGIDAEAPQVLVSQPVAGMTLSGVVQLLCMPTDNTGVVKVEWYVDNTLVGTSTEPYSSWLDTSRFSDGAHNIVAKAYDAAGNIGIESIAVSFLNQDFILPTVSIVSPASGSTVFKKGAQIQVNASDNVGVTMVETYLNGRLSASSATSPYTTKLAYRLLNTGSNSIYCVARDAAGNLSQSNTIILVKG